MCQVAESYDVIFLGKAVKAEVMEQQDGPGLMHSAVQAKFRIIEPFRGLPPGRRTINLSYDLGAEDFHFAKGVSYIVYARRGRGGRLSVSGCSPTRPLAQAQADINYFRGPGKSAKPKAPCSNR